MAKNFPYFKFTVTEWLTGDIVYEDYDVQGLFINICAIYWQRDGKLTLEDINLRYKNPPQMSKLTDRFISVSDGFISVKFLDEQLIEAGHISKVNSINGKKGGRPKALVALEKKPNANRTLTELKPKKSKEEQEEEQELNKNKNIPSEFEFLNYCKTIERINYSSLEFSLKAKFESWVNNNWKDGNDNKIKNWKSKIKNTIPYLKKSVSQPNNNYLADSSKMQY
jgi:hypothetical protein